MEAVNETIRLEEALTEMESLGHKVFICTSPLGAYQNCVAEKFEWIDKHIGKGWIKKIIITGDKTIVTGDYLIDDRPEIEGVESTPAWKHILYDQPYNHNVNKRRLTWTNYKEILNLQF